MSIATAPSGNDAWRPTRFYLSSGIPVIQRGGLQPVSEAGEGGDQRRCSGPDFKFGAEPANPGPQIMNLIPEFRSPNAREELTVHHDAPRIGGELRQQFPLRSAEFD